MGGMTWEEYLWKGDKVIAVPPHSEGRINLLDVFIQDGVAIRSRVLRKIGSMIGLGDMQVEGWKDERKDLESKLRALNDPNDDIGDGPFIKEYEASSVLNFEVSGNSKLAVSAMMFVDASAQKSDSLKVQILSPFHQRVSEEYLIDYINGGDDDPLWKPNLKKIAEKGRKGRSLIGPDEDLELWIVTELRFGSRVGHSATTGRTINANVGMPPGADITAVALAATGLPSIAAGVTASTSQTTSTNVESHIRGRHILYGFKAIRLKYDLRGRYISDKPMGKKQVHVTRAGAEVDDFNPDKNSGYHMGDFFLREDDEGYIAGNFECTPIHLSLDESGDEEGDAGGDRPVFITDPTRSSH